MADSVEMSYGPDGRSYFTFRDATGLHTAEGGASKPDGHIAALVGIDADLGLMLPEDARALGLALIRVAEEADRLNAQHFAETTRA